MRSPDRTLSRPIPAMTAITAALLLALAACTSETGASAVASASAEASTASTEASAEASTEMSAEESAEASEGGGGTTVMLTNFQFDPTEITVSAGDTVTFMNHDSAAHTVTEGQNGNAADGASFDEQVAGGDVVEVTFDEAGDFDVTCLFHANMNMVVHVE